MCSQVAESLDYLLVGRVTSCIVWHDVLAWCRTTSTPPDGTQPFFSWWTGCMSKAPSGLRKGLGPFIALSPYGAFGNTGMIACLTATHHPPPASFKSSKTRRLQ